MKNTQQLNSVSIIIIFIIIYNNNLYLFICLFISGNGPGSFQLNQ